LLTIMLNGMIQRLSRSDIGIAMRYYNDTPTTYSTFEVPEDKSPLELRPSLEKGEEAHVRDCLTWHTPSPRHTFG
jgi:hypothetical protein